MCFRIARKTELTGKHYALRLHGGTGSPRHQEYRRSDWNGNLTVTDLARVLRLYRGKVGQSRDVWVCTVTDAHPSFERSEKLKKKEEKNGTQQQNERHSNLEFLENKYRHKKKHHSTEARVGPTGRKKKLITILQLESVAVAGVFAGRHITQKRFTKVSRSGTRLSKIN